MSSRQVATIAPDFSLLAVWIGNSPLFNTLDSDATVASAESWHGPAKDIELIAIFTALGLLLFGGGAYAIYDGWPYLVLERGFTEVIIGAIANSAGLIMLSLAWVLKEVRATRRALVEAIELRAQAPLPAAAVEQAPFAVPARPEAPAFSRSVAPAAISAVAGAAATSVVAQALAVSDDERAPAPAEAPASSGDRDLFGALVAQKLEEPEPAVEDEPEAAAEPVAESAGPLPDMFEEALLTVAAPEPEPKPLEYPAAFEAEGHEPAELVAAKVLPAAEEDALSGQDEPEPFGASLPEEQPVAEREAIPDEPVEALAAIEDELDEFSALRASLAGHLNEPEPETGRIEPSFSPEPDPFAAAESWMDKASPRREPWLDTPPAEAPAPAPEAAPLWPPRTEAHAFDAPAEPVAIGAEAETFADLVKAPAHEEPGTTHAEALPEPAAVDEPPTEEPPAPADSRAASDEGVVGAYQVGDAHFTIYADGSIRARTPEGEYSFASMDELKVYLASEKSRLGV